MNRQNICFQVWFGAHTTDPGRDTGIHYSNELQRDTMLSSDRGKASHDATDPAGRDKGVHYSNELQRETMSNSECGKLALGVAKRNKNGSTPAWIMIESASTPMTFEPRCSNIRNSLLSLLISVGAKKKN